MPDNEYTCDICGEDFTSLDEFIEGHLLGDHELDRNQIELFYNLPDETKQPEVVESQTPENQTILTPMIENPDDAEKVVSTIGDEATRILTEVRESTRVNVRQRLYLSGMVVFIILVVLLALTVLTFQGVISGSVFAFSLGTLIGYLLTFLDDYL